ncbi:MAG: GNAT family N-acetyltransferase [Candidatus Bathyarchaeia archaeon]
MVYSYPPPTCFGRRLVLPKMSMKELNEKMSTITRVVVHPKYRSMGLGAKLIRETLPLAGTPLCGDDRGHGSIRFLLKKRGCGKLLSSKQSKAFPQSLTSF